MGLEADDDANDGVVLQPTALGRCNRVLKTEQTCKSLDETELLLC